jgi:hypothetical protein
VPLDKDEADDQKSLMNQTDPEKPFAYLFLIYGTDDLPMHEYIIAKGQRKT